MNRRNDCQREYYKLNCVLNMILNGFFSCADSDSRLCEIFFSENGAKWPYSTLSMKKWSLILCYYHHDRCCHLEYYLILKERYPVLPCRIVTTLNSLPRWSYATAHYLSAPRRTYNSENLSAIRGKKINTTTILQHKYTPIHCCWLFTVSSILIHRAHTFLPLLESMICCEYWSITKLTNQIYNEKI